MSKKKKFLSFLIFMCFLFIFCILHFFSFYFILDFLIGVEMNNVTIDELLSSFENQLANSMQEQASMS